MTRVSAKTNRERRGADIEFDPKSVEGSADRRRRPLRIHSRARIG
jgi:hypothetical protein